MIKFKLNLNCKINFLKPSKEWLKSYGYVEDSGKDGPAASKDLSEALKKMQHYAGINETGMLDDETKEMMKKKRCGNSDVKISVSKRFSAVGSYIPFWNFSIIYIKI